jgi:hypothetical protein
MVSPQLAILYHWPICAKIVDGELNADVWWGARSRIMVDDVGQLAE